MTLPSPRRPALRRPALRVSVVIALLLGGSLATIPAIAASPLTVSPTHVSFSSTHVGATALKPVTVKVAAGYQIDDVYQYSGAAFSVKDVGAGCSAPGPATCTFDAGFSPSVTGATSGSINVYACPPSGTNCASVFVQLTGTAVAPGTSPAINFGRLKVGLATSKTFTVKHDAGWAVVNVGFDHQPTYGFGPTTFAVPSAPSDINAYPCGQSPTATSCAMTGVFSPRSLDAQSDTMDVQLCQLVPYGLCTTLTSTVSGVGLAPATVTPPSITFPNTVVTGTTDASVKLTLDSGWHYSGYGTSYVPGQPDGVGEFRVYNDFYACPAGSTTCTLTIEFHPDAAQKYVADLLVNVCNANNEICVDLDQRPRLTGTGTQDTTKTVLRSSASTVSAGSTVTLTATVSPNPTYSGPDGTVTFKDGKTVLCTDPLALVKGAFVTATCSAVLGTPTGPHSLTATYSGNAPYKTSTSGAVTVRVTS
ncbi:MAG: hypothetical protein JWP74_2863 [Marmoricola sp.]|nr:hypothetical protein [Marmoricola sp.]